MKFEERFWSKVDIKEKDDCWNWMACSRGISGYGCIRVGNKVINSHRIAWILSNGKIPEGLWVLHKCKQNRLCCNPNHLYLGTQFNNMRDSIKDGTNRLLFPHNVSKGKIDLHQN